MTRQPDRCRALCRCLAAAFLLVAPPASAADMVAHAATYDLGLRVLRMDAKPTRSEGQLRLSVGRICEGWKISTQLNFWVETTDGQSMRIETVNGVEESADGDLLSFSTLSRLNGEVQSQSKGAASGKPGAAGRVVFTSPGHRDLPLPKGTLFPAAGGRLLLDRLIAGKTQVQRKIFDGSSAEPFDVLDTVAPGQLAPGGAPKGNGGNLLAAASWRLISLWTRDGGREKVQKIEMQLHANGVVSRMLIDLGLVVMDARLMEIHRLPQPACRTGKP